MMSFLQRGLLLFAVFFVTGNGQFLVSSPFYAGSKEIWKEPPSEEGGGPLEEPITGTTFTSSFNDGGENRKHTKNIITDNRNKNWMEVETDEVSDSVPNIYGYPNNANTAEQNEISVRYFDTMNPPQPPNQKGAMEGIRALLALRTLASQLGNLLFFLEKAPVPLSMFMLSGALNLNQEPKPPSDKSMSPTKDGLDNKQSGNNQEIVKKTIIAEQPPIILPFGMSPPGEQISTPGSLSQYFANLNSDNLKTSKPKPFGEQISHEFNPDMYLPDFNNNMPMPGMPNYGRRRIDNNLRRVQSVPYSGIFPDYNQPQDPYPDSMQSFYFPDDPMQTLYGRPKEHPLKKAWKKEQHRLLKEKIQNEGIEKEKKPKKQSKKQRDEMKREDVDDYMYWQQPPHIYM